MKLSKLFISVLMLSMLALTACGKRSNSGSQVADGRNARNGTGTMNPVGNGSQQSGYLQASNPSQFQELVKTLVSPTLDPQYLGTVDSYSGVRVGGKIQLGQGYTIRNDPQFGSSFGIEIHDSFVGQNDGGSTIQPYFINMSKAQGQWQGTPQNGSMTVTFQDDYGIVKLTGNWNTSYFQGTVSFRNSSNTQSTNLSSQCSQQECTLGQFTANVCSVFRCD